MLCGACGLNNPEQANFCLKCGSALAAVAEVALVGVPHTILTDAPAPFFYPCSPSKLFVLTALSFGLYSTYWFWSQWREEDPNEGRGWVLFKTLLSGFFFYSMAREAKEEAERHEVSCRYSPAALTAMLVGVLIAFRIRVDDGWTLVLAWLLPLPLLIVQLTINRVNWTVAHRRGRGWRWWEITVSVVLGLLWTLVIIGLFLPTLPTE